MQRADQLGDGGAAVPEVAAHRDHDQRGRLLPSPGRARGGGAQGGDERLAGGFPVRVRVQGEDLLELVDDDRQPRRAVTSCGRWRGLAGGSGEDRRPDGQVRLVRTGSLAMTTNNAARTEVSSRD